MEEAGHDDERKSLVRSLTKDDLRLLSDAQLRDTDAVSLERVNKKALSRVREVMEGKEGEILKALTEEPFIYVSPSIQILPTMKVRFASTLSSQEIDAKEAINKIYREDETLDLVSARVNLIYLAHSIVDVNGGPAGGVALDPEHSAQLLIPEAYEAAKEHLADIRVKRVRWLLSQPPMIVDRMVEFSRAFQAQINALTKDEKLLDTLGN